MSKTNWSKVINYLSEKESATTEELSAVLSISKSTIRRTLQELEDLNIINRFRGGAILRRKTSDELPADYKRFLNADAKKKIARTAYSLVENNMIIYLDGGTTSLELAKLISSSKGLMVVTPNLQIASFLSRKNVKVFILPGFVKEDSVSTTLNQQGFEILESLKFDLAFLGSAAVHSHYGLTGSNVTHARINKTVISLSKASYVLADSSKYNKVLEFKSCDIDDVKIISDQKIEGIETIF